MRLASQRTAMINTLRTRLIHILINALGAEEKAINLPQFEKAETLEEGLAALGLTLNKITDLMEAAEAKAHKREIFSQFLSTLCDLQVETYGDAANNLLNLPSQENENTLMHIAALMGWENSCAIMVNQGGDIHMDNVDDDDQAPPTAPAPGK